MRPKIRLQTLLTGTVVLAALLPTLLIGLFLYGDSWREREKATQQSMRQARFAADRVEQAIASRQEEFALLQQQAALAREAGSTTLERLLREPQLARSFRALEIRDSGGEVIGSWVAAGQSSPRRLLSEEVMGRLQEGTLVLADAHGNELPDLALVGEIPGPDGMVLVAEINPEPLRVELTQYATLMAIWLRLGEAPPSGVPPVTARGVAEAQAPIAGTSLNIWVGPLTQQVDVGGTQRLWLALAVGGLGIAPAILFGRQITGLIQRALSELEATSNRIAQGDHEARVPPVPRLAPVELHQLAESLNRLGGRLYETHDALVHANSDLERRVAERTEELAQRTVDLGYSRATLYAVMESMNDGLVLITPDRRIRYINRNTEAMLSFREPLYPGRSADRLYSAVADACESGLSPEQLASALVSPEASPVLTVKAGSGQRYLRWRTFSIHNATGAHLGLGHLLTDVTQEHEIDRVKSELISTVSHELRTPLTAIRASISSLLRPNVEWDEETRSDFLVTIFEESRHLQELIENLLDMSKIEAGVLRLDLVTASVERLVESVVSRARGLYPDHALSVLLPPGLPPVMIDSRRMEQVLLNLIDNAVKYGKESRVVELRAEKHAHELWLAVRDEGMGIPADHLNLIFERFHRVDSTLTRNTGGNGLGLAICRGIVEGHGGRIWAESELGRGTTIYVALPVAEEE